ncbi:hypothetical protein CBS63078_8672 [Aspergillus niger]|nr:hypothetical protein CBS63078_8672 [Aspergillus niger]
MSTPTRDWPRLGGWDGPGTTTRHTQHKHLYSTGLGWVGWDGPGITTRHTQHRLITGLASWLGGWDGPGRPYIIYTHLRPNSTVSCLRVGFQFGFWFIDLYRLTNVPGPTVGWMGQAWDIEYNTQHRLVHGSGLMVGWMGRAWKTIYCIYYYLAQHSEYLSELTSYFTDSQVHCSGEPGLGWVVGTGLGHRAWGWGFEAIIVHHCSEPGLGWAVGTGLGHGFNTCCTSSPPQ